MTPDKGGFQSGRGRVPGYFGSPRWWVPALQPDLRAAGRSLNFIWKDLGLASFQALVFVLCKVKSLDETISRPRIAHRDPGGSELASTQSSETALLAWSAGGVSAGGVSAGGCVAGCGRLLWIPLGPFCSCHARGGFRSES